MSKILYTSAEVRKAIARLFSESKGNRVAISAFVGEGADLFLPKPKGLKLICWPKAGGTNPNALRKLMQSKVKVFFSDSIHMKVYWAEDLGVVITSANLSNNALGSGNLREIGVQLPKGALDMERVMASIKPCPISKQELHRLDRQHKLYIVYPKNWTGN
jgi:phosphatidylserine/phosphatidylglycerophosphate/cardiolipin synthase-like enzyme